MRHWRQDHIDTELEREGLEALEDPDPGDWACFEDAGAWLPVVAQCRAELQMRGTFERALLRAWHANLGTTASWSPEWIEELFLVHADRDRLLLEGDPVPPGRNFRIFRGVAGVGDQRREHGLAWTLHRTIAERFAECSRDLGLAEPVALEGCVTRQDVLAHLKCRNEAELICTNVTLLSRHALRT